MQAFCLLALLLAVPPSPFTTGDGWRLRLPPAGVSRLASEDVRLPWGHAVERSTIFEDGRGMVWVFASYEPAKGTRGQPSPRRLKELPRAFLRNRGCVARVLSTKPQQAAGAPRPAIVFGGSCEGGDRYRRAALIVDGRLFAFHVAWTSAAAGPDLASALADFIAGFELTAR